MCEAYHCLPHQAIEAIESDVGGLLFRIIDLRAYAKAKRIFDSTDMEKRPTGYLMDLVGEITVAIVKERLAAHTKVD